VLKVVAKFTVKEDKVEEFIRQATNLVAESRKEEGCI